MQCPRGGGYRRWHDGDVKIAEEQIVAWNPDILFVDLVTLTAAGGGSIVELRLIPPTTP
ncbi:MAG: hypothetical protein MJ014_01615 [Methanocorpusculum sp.]|nr:hypothetical protein [Methanocorpusculum sp.]